MSTVSIAPELSSTRQWLARSRGWMSLSIMAPVALAVFFSKPPAVEGSWLDAAIDVGCWILFVLGAFTRWWATLYIGGNKSNRVICEGPYSICRNPLYLGTFLMTGSLVLQMMSLTLGLIYLLATAWYMATTISVEEHNLRRKFGEDFVAYQKSVPRLIPNFSLYQSQPELDVKVEGLVAEAKRMLRWGALPMLAILIVQLRSQPWWPDVFHLP